MADEKKNPLIGAFRAPVPGAASPIKVPEPIKPPFSVLGKPAEEKKPTEPPKAPTDGKTAPTAPDKPEEVKKPTEPPKAPTDGKPTLAAPGKPDEVKKPTEPPKAPTDGKPTPAAPGKPDEVKKPAEPPKAPTDGKPTPAAPGKLDEVKKPAEPPKAPTDGKATPTTPGKADEGKKSPEVPKAPVGGKVTGPTTPPKPDEDKKPVETPKQAAADPNQKNLGSRTAEGPKGSTVTEIFPDRLDYPSDQDMHSLPVPKEGQVFSMAVHPAYLKDFLDHPFSVNRETDDYKELCESIRKYGITAPVECRIGRDGGLEIISGHRRHDIAVQLNYPIPVTIAVVDDDDAQIRCVDGNLHRKDIPLSELARAAKMKMDALKRKAGRRTKTEVLADILEGKDPPKRSDEQVAEDLGVSRATVQRVLTVNNLAEPLKKMVDKKELPLDTAEQISHMKKEEQHVLADAIEKEGGKVPSKTEAVKLKEASKAGTLTAETIEKSVAPTKREVDPPLKVMFNDEELRPYFPNGHATVPDVKRAVFEGLDLRKLAIERQAAKTAKEAKETKVKKAEPTR